MHGGSPGLGPLPQQRRVLDKLVPAVPVQVVGAHLAHLIGVVVLVVVGIQRVGLARFPRLQHDLLHHRLVGLVPSLLLRNVLLVVQRLSSVLSFPAGGGRGRGGRNNMTSPPPPRTRHMTRPMAWCSPPALPDARHVHLLTAEHVKLIVVKHVGPDVQNIWNLLLHWPAGEGGEEKREGKEKEGGRGGGRNRRRSIMEMEEKKKKDEE
ncbi:hypothetical protein EYF80_031623 [Liparis tanakae]|uniref:Uncharacterized protein n=1 Tax=Liparis tanakae TaxID=230148 RepID=A0A4Z2GY46_9TELE|nr:hypothetical protein EYF80_031623 [Liparis tanakae]